MPRFVHAPELLEIMEWNKGGTNLVGYPVVPNNVIEFIEIDVCRALVKRFCDRLNDQNIIEQRRVFVNVFVRDV